MGRRSDDPIYEPFDPYELGMVGGIGCVMTITPIPPLCRHKVRPRRPIGYMADIDTFLEGDA